LTVFYHIYFVKKSVPKVAIFRVLGLFIWQHSLVSPLVTPFIILQNQKQLQWSVVKLGGQVSS